MPRRLAAPSLADGDLELEPLARSLSREMRWLLDPDPEIAAFTYIPSTPDTAFLESWLGRYEDGWTTGERAGFAVRSDGETLGFAAYVRLELQDRQGEIGYMLAPGGRGRGLASRAVNLLTGWGFDTLGLERVELRIDTANIASARVAERAGYACEGVLRNLAFKEGRRTDVGIWARIRSG